jgi:hypothetical protein
LYCVHYTPGTLKLEPLVTAKQMLDIGGSPEFSRPGHDWAAGTGIR